MFKQLAALLVSGMVMAGGAFAQPMVCQIDNNFTGVFVGQPGNYTVTVTPGATATLSANCSASVNSYDWSPGNAQTPTITVTAPGTTGSSATYTLTGCNSGTETCGAPVTITIQAGSASPPLSATLSFDGQLRDRVSKSDAGVAPDGQMDGVFTLTLPLAAQGKSIKSMDLKGPNGNEWDTIVNALWIVGVARGLDSPLANQADGTLDNNGSNAGIAVGNNVIFKLFVPDSNPTSFALGNQFTVTVNFSDGTTATGSATIAAVGNAVELFGLEVTQGVQNLNNFIPLVAGKATFVRAYVRALTAVSNGVKVTASLTAKNAATGTVLGKITNSNAGRGINVLQSTATGGPARVNLDDSFYFQLPSDWTNAGSVEFTFAGNEIPIACNETDAIKDCKVTVQFQDRRKFSIKFVMTTYIDTAGKSYAPSTADLVQTMTEIRANFPMADFGTALQTTWTTKQEYCTGNGISQILADLKTMRAADCGSALATTGKCRAGIEDFHFVLLPEPFTNGYCTSGYTASGIADTLFDRDGIKSDNTGNTAVAMAESYNSRAHELGHNFGLHHTCNSGKEAGCGYHDPADGTMSAGKAQYDPATYYGFDPIRDTLTGLTPLNSANGPYINHGRVYDANTPDMMSYGPAAWPSGFTYLRLFNALSPTAGSAANAGTEKALLKVTADKLFLIDGTVSFADGTGQIGNVYTIDLSGTVTLPPPGDYAIRFEDALGNLLATYSFQVGQFSEGTMGGFSLQLPKDPAARRIVLLHNGQVLAGRIASANPPTVTVTSPNGGETLNGPTANFTWTAADPDGDPLKYAVEYSTDAGATWKPLTMNWDSTTYPVDLTRLPASNQALIRVTATDGFNSAQDQSNATFTVPEHAPETVITGPANNRLFIGDQTIILEGMGLDVTDGLLGDASLTWMSSLNGVLGTGNSLAISTLNLLEGTHTITLTAKNSTARVGNAAISIQVFRTRPTLPAALDVGPTALAFTATFGSAQPGAQQVSIRNSGDGGLNWSASTDQTWLTVNATSGAAPANLSITADPAGFAVGQYTANVMITSTDTANSPQKVTVVLSVTATPIPPAQVVEYLNTADFPGSPGGHFFYSSDPAEQAAVDAGAAGAFVRTGRSFNTGGTSPVCRFYGSVNPGPNSHFFTVDAGECSALRALQITPTPTTVPQWNYEGLGFSTTPAIAAANGARACPANTLPVYRAYNNAFPLSGPKNPWDSNHRLTLALSDIAAMVAIGWRDEGIVFCAAQ